MVNIAGDVGRHDTAEHEGGGDEGEADQGGHHQATGRPRDQSHAEGEGAVHAEPEVSLSLVNIIPRRLLIG